MRLDALLLNATDRKLHFLLDWSQAQHGGDTERRAQSRFGKHKLVCSEDHKRVDQARCADDSRYVRTHNQDFSLQVPNEFGVHDARLVIFFNRLAVLGLHLSALVLGLLEYKALDFKKRKLTL